MKNRNRKKGTLNQMRNLLRYLSVAGILNKQLIQAARKHFFPNEKYAWLETLLTGKQDFQTYRFIAGSNATFIWLRPEVLKRFREELMGDQNTLERALDFLSKYRDTHSTSLTESNDWLLFEEKTIKRALMNDVAGFDRLIGICMKNVMDYSIEELIHARRARSLYEALPAAFAARCTELNIAAGIRLGIITDDFGPEHFHLLPKEVEVGVRKVDGDILFSFSTKNADQVISVPGTNPRFVKIESPALIAMQVAYNGNGRASERTFTGEKQRMAIWECWNWEQNPFDPTMSGVRIPASTPFEISTLSGVRYRLGLDETGSICIKRL